MSVTEPVAGSARREVLQARLGRRSWFGAALGILFSGLLLGSLAWVVAGWIQLPRAWIPFCAGAALLFAGLEIGVQRRSRARLAPVLSLLAECVDRLPAPQIGHHRGLPWVAGERGGRRFTALVEWDGGERLRLGLTVDAELDVSLRVVPAEAADRPDRWLSRLRARHRHRDVSDLPPTLIGLSPDPEKAEALWGRSPMLVSEAEALATALLPRAAVVDVQPDGVGWDGPLHEPALDVARIDDVLDRLVALADGLEPLCGAETSAAGEGTEGHG